MALDKFGKELPKGIYYVKKTDRYCGRVTWKNETKAFYEKDNIKRLAKRMNDCKHDLEHGIYGDMKEVTLNKWFGKYIEVFKAGKVKDTTLNHYKIYYRLYVREDRLGKKKLRDIKPMDVQEVFNHMSQKGLKLNTIKKVSNILYGTFKQAVNNGYMAKNPCESTTMPKEKKRKVEALSSREQQLFLQFVQNSKKWGHYYPLFAIAFSTGMRVGELTGLQWDTVNLKKKEIYVVRNMQYIQDEETKKCKFVVQTPKTDTSERTIPMFDKVADAFKEQRRMQSEYIMLQDNEWDQAIEPEFQNLVFTTSTGKPISHTSINRTIGSIVKAINKEEQEKAKKELLEYKGIQNFTPHVIRHSFATRCFEKRITPKLVQTIMGHSTLAITMDLYTDVFPDEDINYQEIERISDVI